MTASAQKYIADHDPAGRALQAYTIDDFCHAYRICRASFYNLLKAGNGPRTMKVGQRTLISVQAADEWRARMEQVAAGDAA